VSDLRKAAEQALEALENAEDQLPKPYSTQSQYAITALRQALALEKFSEVNQELEEAIKKGTKAWADVPDATKWVDELRGETEQEPVEYTGNGTAGREADVRPTGFLFQMPKEKNT